MRRPQNLKESPTFLTKQLFSLSTVKTSGFFFQILWPFQKNWTLQLKSKKNGTILLLNYIPYFAKTFFDKLGGYNF